MADEAQGRGRDRRLCRRGRRLCHAAEGVCRTRPKALSTQPRAPPTTQLGLHRWTTTSGPSGCGQLQALIELMRPAVQADGGDLVLVSADVETGVVEVQLQGACSSCAVSVVHPAGRRGADPHGADWPG